MLTLCLRILVEALQAVNEVGTVEWIATNTDTCGLAQTSRGRLRDSLVCQRARARHNACESARRVPQSCCG